MSGPSIALVVAVGENGVIGRDGGLPWRLKSDLRRFRTVTMGKPIIMGRKTFQSIGRALDGRENIVVTRDHDFSAPGIRLAGSLEEAVRFARAAAEASGADEICVIGGAGLFVEALPLATRLHVTHVRASPPGDVRLPADFLAGWRLAFREDLPFEEGDTAPAVYSLYERKAAD